MSHLGIGWHGQALVNKVRELVEKEHEVFQAREKQKEALLEVRTEISSHYQETIISSLFHHP